MRNARIAGLVAAVALGLGAAGSASASVIDYNGGGATIPGTATTGPASRYPLTISVPDALVISDVAVVLSGLSHTFPDDLDILLRGPGGQTVLLMSDAGGGFDINGVNFTFDGDALTVLADSTQLVSGNYLPTNYGQGNDPFADGGPTHPYGGAMSVFNGTLSNGLWSLFIRDDNGGDSGSLAGWALNITGTPPVSQLDALSIPEPSMLALFGLGLGLVGLVAMRRLQAS
jgi:subtilisin-like proprotein convertase family protein